MAYLKKTGWSWKMNISLLQGTGFDLERDEIVDYRGSESLGF